MPSPSPPSGSTPPPATTLRERGHASINGLDLYHEVHGRAGGVPLLLLHGGGSTIDSTWGVLLPWLARDRCVIAIEEQAHGRSSDRPGPLTFEASADDGSALLRHLGVAQVDVLGFSNGASIALHLALRHPSLVRALVFASAMTRRDGAVPQLWEFMEHADVSNMPAPLKDAFLRVTPDEAKLRVMHDKDAARMRAFSDLPDDALASIAARTLIVAGDRDVVRPEHAVELSRCIPGSRLLILPAGHGDYLGEISASPASGEAPGRFAAMVSEFLGLP